jgi:hypothetical protein
MINLQEEKKIRRGENLNVLFLSSCSWISYFISFHSNFKSRKGCYKKWSSFIRDLRLSWHVYFFLLHRMIYLPMPMKKKLCDDDEGNKISNKQEMSKKYEEFNFNKPERDFCSFFFFLFSIFNRVSVCIH